MKNVFFLLVLFFSASIVSAQQSGNFWLGGSFGVSVISEKGGSSYGNFKFIPEIGYMLSNKIGVGIKVGYYETGTETIQIESTLDIERSSTNGYIVNPFIRYSMVKNNLGSVFIDGGVGFSQSDNEKTDIESRILEVGIRPGLSLNLSRRIALTAKLGFIGYEKFKVTNNSEDAPRDNENKFSKFGFDFDLSNILLGANFTF